MISRKAFKNGNSYLLSVIQLLLRIRISFQILPDLISEYKIHSRSRFWWIVAIFMIGHRLKVLFREPHIPKLRDL